MDRCAFKALYPIIAVNYVKPFIFAPACPAGNSTTLRLLHGNHEPAESFGPTGLHPRPVCLTTLSHHTLPTETLLEDTAGLIVWSPLQGREGEASHQRPLGVVACCFRFLLTCASFDDVIALKAVPPS